MRSITSLKVLFLFLLLTTVLMLNSYQALAVNDKILYFNGSAQLAGQMTSQLTVSRCVIILKKNFSTNSYLGAIPDPDKLNDFADNHAYIVSVDDSGKFIGFYYADKETNQITLITNKEKTLTALQKTNEIGSVIFHKQFNNPILCSSQEQEEITAITQYRIDNSDYYYSPNDNIEGEYGIVSRGYDIRYLGDYHKSGSVAGWLKSQSHTKNQARISTRNKVGTGGGGDPGSLGFAFAVDLLLKKPIGNKNYKTYVCYGMIFGQGAGGSYHDWWVTSRNNSCFKTSYHNNAIECKCPLLDANSTEQALVAFHDGKSHNNDTIAIDWV